MQEMCILSEELKPITNCNCKWKIKWNYIDLSLHHGWLISKCTYWTNKHNQVWPWPLSSQLLICSRWREWKAADGEVWEGLGKTKTLPQTAIIPTKTALDAAHWHPNSKTVWAGLLSYRQQCVTTYFTIVRQKAKGNCAGSLYYLLLNPLTSIS